MAAADEVSVEGDGQGAGNDEGKVPEGSMHGEPYFVCCRRSLIRPGVVRRRTVRLSTTRTAAE